VHVPAKTVVALGDACVAAGVEVAKKVAIVRDSIAATNSGRTYGGSAKLIAVHEQLIALRTMLRKRKKSIIAVLFTTTVRARTQRTWNRYCLLITNSSMNRMSFANGEIS
jgi:hypothetical protein